MHIEDDDTYYLDEEDLKNMFSLACAVAAHDDEKGVEIISENAETILAHLKESSKKLVFRPTYQKTQFIIRFNRNYLDKCN